MMGAQVQGCKGARVRGALVRGARVRAALVQAAVAGALTAALVSPGFAQHEGHQMPPARPAAPVQAPVARPPDRVNGVEPIRCWRQASAGAIAIGETFTVTLTCAIYDGQNAQVVPDESRLNVASIQMAPFEILGGAHPADVRRGFRRFLQYDYQLRIISRDAIGHDVNIPPLTISYRIHSGAGGPAALEGRDLSYLLPMMPIKVLSLVPADAGDIRDASETSLGAVESLRFRASLYRILTYVFGALAAAMAVLALVPLARPKASVAAARRDEVSDRAVLRAAIGELTDVQSRASTAGWSDEDLTRALASARLVAAAAIGRGISRKPVNGAAPPGRLAISDGILRRRRATVASAVTAEDLRRASASGGFSATRQQALDDLAGTLATFSAALYARQPKRESDVFDSGVRQAVALAWDVASERPRWSGWWARR